MIPQLMPLGFALLMISQGRRHDGPGQLRWILLLCHGFEQSGEFGLKVLLLLQVLYGC